MRGTQLLSAALAGAAIVAFMAPADAQVLVGGNDTKVWWDDAGKVLQRAPGKDTISVIDIGDRENPRILSNLELENSIFGPPTNLAVHPSGDIALVANSVTQTKEGENWKPVPDNKVYVIDLKANPPQRIATVEVGKQPSGLDISRKGDLALVTNRADTSISVLSITGKDVKVIDTVAVGDSVAHVARGRRSATTSMTSSLGCFPTTSISHRTADSRSFRTTAQRAAQTEAWTQSPSSTSSKLR